MHKKLVSPSNKNQKKINKYTILWVSVSFIQMGQKSHRKWPYFIIGQNVHHFVNGSKINAFKQRKIKDQHADGR